MIKTIIRARDIVKDIRSGMSDAELMEKYNLSSKGLQSAFTKLANGGIISVEELYDGKRRLGADTVVIDDVRTLPRHYLSVSASIYEMAFPDRLGKLQDITERGLGIIGIIARIGEVKSLVIPCREYLALDSIQFEAVCIWSESGRTVKEWHAGFQITKISSENMAHLRELVRLLSLG
jgi:hypothetical protein